MQAASIIREMDRWLNSDALPFWAERGVDLKHGGFVEALSFSGHDQLQPFKRTRVTCRQIYVFSHAKLLGWDNTDALIAHGIEFLTRKAWQDKGSGFARRLTRQGEILDPTADLYEHAFALFAFAWAYMATDESYYLEWAHKTLDFVEQHLSHPSGKGFLHEAGASGLRPQNPHMHLLEACTAAYRASINDRFLCHARRLEQLFAEYLLDQASGALPEFFKDDWTTAPGMPGRLIEPGHLFEWVWILNTCREAIGVDRSRAMHALRGFAECHGLNDRTGGVMNVVRDDGLPIDAGSRTWPNTERLKAAVALYELHGFDPLPVIAETGRVILHQYLAPAPGFNIPRGTWIDGFDGAGKPIAEGIPASTLYHLMLAFTEVLRIEEKLASHPRQSTW